MKPRVFLAALFAAIVLIPSAAASQGLLVGFVANVLRRYPSIRDVAVWTEPNSSKFWQPRKGSAAAYEALLATCWDTLHKAFDGTGQAVPGNKGVSVWYLEDGFQSTPPAGGFVYTGIESDKQPVVGGRPGDPARGRGGARVLSACGGRLLQLRAERLPSVQTLILARHGESEYSARGLLNGDPSVAVGLTGTGEAQAVALGRALRETQIDLCVTTQFGRTRRTAELALAGRNVPLEIWPDLNDPHAGSWEGLAIDDYRAWASTAGSAEPIPGGGQSRQAIVTRCARAYRALLERPEATILVVLHALPLAYLLEALDGTPPAARIERVVGYADPHSVDAGALGAAVELLEAWTAAPGW